MDPERGPQGLNQQNVNRNSVIVTLTVFALVIGVYIIVYECVQLKPLDERPKPMDRNMTPEEYNETYLSPIPIDPSDKDATSTANTSVPSVDQLSKIPDKFDWREEGFVGNVKNQGNCLSCWAFSISSAMETQLSIKRNKLTKLSVMHLWKTLPGMANCTMKNHKLVLEDMMENNITLLTRDCYKMTIRGRKRCTHSVGVLNYTLLRCPTTQEIMRIIYEHGPVIAVVDATTWKYYSGKGVINEGCSACNNSEHVLDPQCCSCCRSPAFWDRPCEEQSCNEPNFNHVVVIVGYDSTAAVPHFIVQTSWGTGFGDQGYVRVAMGNNVCGIETSITYLDIIEYL